MNRLTLLCLVLSFFYAPMAFPYVTNPKLGGLTTGVTSTSANGQLIVQGGGAFDEDRFRQAFTQAELILDEALGNMGFGDFSSPIANLELAITLLTVNAGDELSGFIAIDKTVEVCKTQGIQTDREYQNKIWEGVEETSELNPLYVQSLQLIRKIRIALDVARFGSSNRTPTNQKYLVDVVLQKIGFAIVNQNSESRVIEGAIFDYEIWGLSPGDRDFYEQILRLSDVEQAFLDQTAILVPGFLTEVTGKIVPRDLLTARIVRDTNWRSNNGLKLKSACR